MDILGRYYTADLFSNLLIEKLSPLSPDTVLELGVGGGALIKAALNRWGKAQYLVADVDPNSLEKIKNDHPLIKTFHFDTIRENVSEKLNIKNESIDIAICNPPYLKIKNGVSYNEVFEEARLRDCQKLKVITSDVVFLAKNLQLLKPRGELGIIIPDGLITGKDFENLRKAIIENHNIKGIIQLPEKIFTKTEALTHILIIEKNVPSEKSIPLLLSSKEGEIINQIEVESSSLIHRMDFKYHIWRKKNTNKISNPPKAKTLTLKDLNVEICRGSLSHIELKNLDDHYVHTTTIIHKKKNLSVLNSSSSGNLKLTKKGDILLSRVGCIGKISMIYRGKTLFSDCIYRLRISKKHRQKVWEGLSSEKGQIWLKANSHGVCAKLISKNDLYNFPIEI